MAAKFVKDASAAVWTALDKKTGKDEKADGHSARDLVIRTSPKYRHHLLAEPDTLRRQVGLRCGIILSGASCRGKISLE